MNNISNSILVFFRVTSQILSAGVAITAFSLLLYALTFNLRDRVARYFALILTCVVIVFTSESIGNNATQVWEVNFWLRTEWIGIILLPPTYFHFSDELLALTGKPSRGRRRLLIRFSYLASLLFLICLPFPVFFSEVILGKNPASYLQPNILFDIFSLYFVLILFLTWFNFARAYRRTTTPTSRRRMIYIIIGALAPALGSFPYLAFGSSFATQHQLIFWILSTINNFLVGGLMVVMAYSVAFFGVPWPDRVVKSRLFKWIMRGPVTASITLGISTIVRRGGEAFGETYSALVPIAMVATILLCQYMITIFSPLWERGLFSGKDRDDLELLKSLEDHLITRNDLYQFIELVLAAVCDRLQVPGAYVAALDRGKLELVVTIGENRFDHESVSGEITRLKSENGNLPEAFQWGDDLLVPLGSKSEDPDGQLIGFLGITNAGKQILFQEQTDALNILAHRATLALRDRRTQQMVFKSLESLNPEMEMIQRIKAAGRFDGTKITAEDELIPTQDMNQWVRDALTHYWGGPKLTESPLMKLQVVQEAINTHEGNTTNALRAVLRDAIQKVRPEGERRFTGEWIMYNILDMKFLEGKKVREIAMRLAMSEADLYRKQRMAIEEVAKAVMDMETGANNQNSQIL